MAVIKKKTERVTSQASGYQSRFAPGNVPKGVKAKVEQKGASRSITYTAVGSRKKATPATPKPTPSTWEQKQKKAEADLKKKRQADAKKYGSWPNYYTN